MTNKKSQRNRPRPGKTEKTSKVGRERKKGSLTRHLQRRPSGSDLVNRESDGSKSGSVEDESSVELEKKHESEA